MRLAKVQPVRRIVSAIALCFLAALLSVAAKMAWAGYSGNSPTDITAIKLCPSVEKWIAPALHASPASHGLRHSAASAAMAQNLPAGHSRFWQRTAHQQLSRAAADLAFFSPPLFLRPPPIR